MAEEEPVSSEATGGGRGRRGGGGERVRVPIWLSTKYIFWPSETYYDIWLEIKPKETLSPYSASRKRAGSEYTLYFEEKCIS